MLQHQHYSHAELVGGNPVHHINRTYSGIPGLNPWMSDIPPNCNKQKCHQALRPAPRKAISTLSLMENHQGLSVVCYRQTTQQSLWNILVVLQRKLNKKP